MSARLNQNVLLLGGTGSIGGAVADTLLRRGHRVTCLARSDASEAKLRAAGFETLRGDMRDPATWIARASGFDAVIQAAATWSDDMVDVDRTVTGALIEALATPDAAKTLIYTSGCWEYGNTGDAVATEDTPYDPLPSFGWMIETARQVRECPRLRGMVILPAMVWERDGGVLEHMVRDARERDAVRVIGGEDIRWTLVHRMDLAELYCLMLERGEAGASYNGAGTVSMRIGEIARALARRHGKPTDLVTIPVSQAVRELTEWAEGYALDQQMSSAKAIGDLGWTPAHTDILAELS